MMTRTKIGTGGHVAYAVLILADRVLVSDEAGSVRDHAVPSAAPASAN
jgi:hypothetical protein